MAVASIAQSSYSYYMGFMEIDISKGHPVAHVPGIKKAIGLSSGCFF